MGWFQASFVLGDKAIVAIAEEQASTAVLKFIDRAKRYPEGTAVRIEVHKAKDADVVKTLAKIKLEN